MLLQCVTLKIVAANRLEANSPLKKKKKKETGSSKLSQRLLGLSLGIGGKLAKSVSPVTIPETPAGFISAPFSISFLKWRLGDAEAYITDLSQCKLGGSLQNSIWRA